MNLPFWDGLHHLFMVVFGGGLLLLYPHYKNLIQLLAVRHGFNLLPLKSYLLREARTPLPVREDILFRKLNGPGVQRRNAIVLYDQVTPWTILEPQNVGNETPEIAFLN